ncbi:MAG TPA: HAD-IA family hydrolase [Terriglobia bacterium]|nr:HAD-IA family hydrolase [Terriglobia bacterium]
MSTPVRAIFMDAGYTLLFPQVEKLAEEMTAAGFPADAEQFHKAERAGKKKLDEVLWPQIREGRVPRTSNHVFWEHYLRALMELLEIPAENRAEALERVIAGFRDIHTWSKVLPDTIPTLKKLKSAGYYLAVISNSDGTVTGELQRAGLCDYLEFVIDSFNVGVEKPHPEIFEMALERSGIAPHEAIYVGDTHPIDIGGAELAGLRGILIDRVGAYPEAACPRITSLSELSTLLEKFPRLN